MDRIAEWRPVEPTGPEGTAEQTEDEETEGPADDAASAAQPKPSIASSWSLVGPVLIALTFVGFAIAGAVALFVVSTMPKAAVAIDSQSTPVDATARPAGGTASARPTPSAAGAGATLVVDVEGAVEKSGVLRLPAGSRVGDAVDAAGGYSPQVDIDAATAQLNLAQVLSDGQQIHVPLRGEVAIAVAHGGAEPTITAGVGGVIDVNTASPEQLDTLPGIGPVTAAKIIASRPYASVDELQQHGAVGASTLEKIRALVTVGP